MFAIIIVSTSSSHRVLYSSGHVRSVRLEQQTSRWSRRLFGFVTIKYLVDEESAFFHAASVLKCNAIKIRYGNSHPNALGKNETNRHRRTWSTE
jgi:hypothetical protein